MNRGYSIYIYHQLLKTFILIIGFFVGSFVIGNYVSSDSTSLWVVEVINETRPNEQDNNEVEETFDDEFIDTDFAHKDLGEAINPSRFTLVILYSKHDFIDVPPPENRI